MAGKDDLVVGQTYSLAELGGLVGGGAAITSEDRIITPTLAWERMTVGRLRLWLNEAVENGVVTDDAEVFVDQDPEGNGSHPMRAAAEPVPVEKVLAQQEPEVYVTQIDENAEQVELPAPAVWFGVGY